MDSITKQLDSLGVVDGKPPSSLLPPDGSFCEANVSLDPYALLQLIQCPRCAHPLRSPLRLPCGYTLCRSCLPPVTQQGISYQGDSPRSEHFTCYWQGKGCGTSDENGLRSKHTQADCGVDVTLNKVVEVFDSVLQDSICPDPEIAHQSRIRWVDVQVFECYDDGLIIAGDEKSMNPSRHTEILHNGRYVGIYALMKEGKIGYSVEEVKYEMDEGAHGDASWDNQVLQRLRDACRSELDCQVCYALVLDPLTTACGHTFCRKCVARVLDHSNLCPLCRRELIIGPDVQSEPPNKILSRLIEILWPEDVTARREAVLRDEHTLGDERKLPVFVCTLSFPGMPTSLHIFEPRYRLMIRRSLETGGRIFGMVIYNSSGQPQGDLGQTQFMQYGTTLLINRYELLHDGRSLISAIGTSKFKILDWEMVDGYIVAKTERVDDIPLAEEEALEARDLESTASLLLSTATSSTSEGNESATVPLDTLSSQQLLQLGLDFIEKHRAESAPWLHQRFLLAYGEPPTDAALFPYWLATVLQISEEEKYTLLPLESVRERLKVMARWVRKIETSEWSVYLYFASIPDTED